MGDREFESLSLQRGVYCEPFRAGGCRLIAAGAKMLRVQFSGGYGGAARTRRISIVAFAHKLLIALSRYVNHGEIPAGAVMKAV